MSYDPHTQRHHPPSLSNWILLWKVIVAIGQAASFLRWIFHLRE